MYLERQAPPPKPKVEDGIFGTSGGIGFTKENELFVGRVAMLGFAVSTLINGHAHFFFIWHLQCVD
jgi:photosystem II 22kDa protein